MKTYKVLLNCTSFITVVVNAKNKEEAISEAFRVGGSCPQNGFEFGEFLEVDPDEELEN